MESSKVKVERRLAAILHADVQGYSRLISEDEPATLHLLSSHLEVMQALIRQHGGRPVGSRGDSLLAEFPSVVEAVQSAVEMQRELKVRNAEFPPDRKVEFRIGIHLGEIVVEGEQIHGEGINVAVRIEGLAQAGGICVSEMVYDQIKSRLTLACEDLGEHQLKNIVKPVRVYRVRMEKATASPGTRRDVPPGRLSTLGKKQWQKVGIVLGSLLLLVGGVVTVRYFSSPLLSPQSSSLITQEAPALPLPDKPSIAVLPFTNMSGDPEQEYFSDGMTEDIITDLSKLSGLFVIARTSVFFYKGRAVKVGDVSKELGVRYILEGSVRKADDQVRITAQLIDATVGHQMWAERYDRPLTDIFTLQDEIRQKIVAALEVKLTEGDQERLVHRSTDSLEARDYYWRGREYYLRNSKEAFIQARQMYEQALELDPTYAEAYVGLGRIYWMEWMSQWSPDPQSLERALELAQKAIALDDSLPEAHQLQGWIYLWKNRQYEQAIAEGERAIALNANNADSYYALAHILNFAGKPEDAIGLEEKALRFNPYLSVWQLVGVGPGVSLDGAARGGDRNPAESPSPQPPFLANLFRTDYHLQ